MAEHADDPKHLDLGRLLDQKKVNFELKSPETPDEIRSRLKLAEIEAESKLRTQEAEETPQETDQHGRAHLRDGHRGCRLSGQRLIAVAGARRPGCRNKAMGIITAIVAGGVGFMTGKGSK